MEFQNYAYHAIFAYYLALINFLKVYADVLYY